SLLEEVTQPLGVGDVVLLFTDGVTEAMNEAGEPFGEERLAALVEEHRDLPFEELRDRILREIRAFVGGDALHDDVTPPLPEDPRPLPFEELRDRILREIRAFVGGAALHDDLTLVLLKVNNGGGP